MKCMVITFMLSIIAPLLVLCGGDTRRCYMCTSTNHTACQDPFDLRRATMAGFLRTCPEPAGDKHKPFCRKTHQTVLGNVRVIRSCGFRNHTEECYGTRNAEVVVTSCRCSSDGCNGATLATLAPAALMLTAALRAIY